MDSFNNIIENSLPQVNPPIPQAVPIGVQNTLDNILSGIDSLNERMPVGLENTFGNILSGIDSLNERVAQQAIPAVAPAAVTGLFAWYRARGLPTRVAIATGGLAAGGAAAVAIYKTGKVAVDYTIEAKDKVVEVVSDTTAKVGVIVENISNIPSKIITSTQETISEVTETASNTLKDLVLLGLVGVFIYTINSNSSSSSKRGNINIKYH